MWCTGIGTFSCAGFLSKLEFLDKQVLASRIDDRSRDTHLWIARLFERNFSMAHKWVNAPNV